MVISGEDSSIESLLTGVKQLFQGQKSYVQPSTTQSVNPPADSFTPGAYHAPIHGGWHNLGGFDTSMKRYDDDPKASKGRGHMGLDMGAPAGTPVYAMGAGVVDTTSTDKMGGNFVGVKHPGGLWSYYAHLSAAKVHVGDKVDQNTVVGTVGNTGNPGNPSNLLMTQEGGRTWPHLHFGVKDQGSWVNPGKFFSIPAYDPAYAKNPAKYQKFWLSDEAKQEAQSFNMKEHNQKKRVAFSQELDSLVKYANQFYKLVSG